MSSPMLVSADSHVVEPPDVFREYLDPRWSEHAPRLSSDGRGGECYVVPGLTRTIGLGLAGAAGVQAENLAETGTVFTNIRPGAWQPTARLLDQDLDSITAEVLYPTIGLFLLNHINGELADACMTAYNRWLAEFCAASPSRLIGCGATSVASVETSITTLKNFRSAGLRGALLPLCPSSGQYTSEGYEPLWSTAAELGLPLTFHAMPSSRRAPTAGSAAAALLPMWDAQELLTGLVFSGVLHRWPDLRVVFAEFDAGWVAHLAQRLDHYFGLHYKWLKLKDLIDRPPSEYIRKSVYFTVQDDPIAFANAESSAFNLMWASDFPHAESTWPKSMKVYEEAAHLLSLRSRDRIFSETAATLYSI